MARSSLKHIVFICGLGMTHIRPGLHFCARLASKFPGVFISVYTPGPLSTQADNYLATFHADVYGRIRVVPSVVDVPLTGPLDIMFSMERSFGPWISNLIASSSLEINEFAVEPPSYIIEDHINGGIALANKDKHGLPIASWWVASAVSFLSHFGSEKHSHGDKLPAGPIEHLEKHDKGVIGKPDQESLGHEVSNRLVCIPGIPPHYEHEQMPQLMGDKLALIAQLRSRWDRMLEDTDIVVFTGVYEMEAVAAELCADGFTKPLKPFCVGLAADLPHPVTPALSLKTSDPVLSFMNRAYTELGPNSVMYIAFGTLWFPPAESVVYLKTLIEEIVARGLRFVFSIKPEYAMIAGLNEGYIEKLTKSGRGMFPDWVRQLDVLEHPALHYFISHGGWNSSTEAIVRGVPMIFWPIAGDQPINAIHIAQQHDCGFELLQVRTGAAKTIAYRPNGDIPIIGSDEEVRKEMQKILDMTQGARGAQQRHNVKALGKVARESIASGGSGDTALERFGKEIGL